jgi:hypothetical protein
MADAKGMHMAEAKGKHGAAKGEFEYRRNRTDRTRYEIRLAQANAEEIARERSEAVTGDVAADRAKEAKAEEGAAKADVKALTKISSASEIAGEKPAKARAKT